MKKRIKGEEDKRIKGEEGQSGMFILFYPFPLLSVSPYDSSFLPLLSAYAMESHSYCEQRSRNSYGRDAD